MIRKWIIRGLALTLVALCAAAWAGSYFQSMVVAWSTHGDNWRVMVDDGTLIAVDYVNPAYVPLPWLAEVHASRVAWGAHGYSYWTAGTRGAMGFAYTPLEPYMMGTSRRVGAAPLWFVTALACVLTWRAWRWTRARNNGKGFPVEAGVGALGH